MTQQEYEQKRRGCWKEFQEEVFNGNISYCPIEAFDYAFDRAFALGRQEKDADTVISGWVARDESGDLYMYIYKPKKISNLGYWDGDVADVAPSNNLFPDLTWESEPQEVEIIIKRKKNG